MLKTSNGEIIHLTRAKSKIASKIFDEAFKHEQNSPPVGKVDALLNQRYDSSEFFVNTAVSLDLIPDLILNFFFLIHLKLQFMLTTLTSISESYSFMDS